VSRVDLLIPDIGNFSDVAVVDVLVKPGDVVDIDSPLVTLETDKASMDVPATAAGTITEVLLKRGDKDGAERHLHRFLEYRPHGAEAERWVKHAEETLEAMKTGTLNPERA